MKRSKYRRKQRLKHGNGPAHSTWMTYTQGKVPRRITRKSEPTPVRYNPHELLVTAMRQAQSIDWHPSNRDALHNYIKGLQH